MIQNIGTTKSINGLLSFRVTSNNETVTIDRSLPKQSIKLLESRIVFASDVATLLVGTIYLDLQFLSNSLYDNSNSKNIPILLSDKAVTSNQHEYVLTTDSIIPPSFTCKLKTFEGALVVNLVSATFVFEIQSSY